MRLYHASLVPNLTTLIPKRPVHFLTKHLLEEGKTKRISFAPSIKSCLRGVNASKGKTYYIYEPTSISDKYLYNPTREEVPDVGLTNEYWYLRPVNVRLVAVVKAGKIINPKVFYFDPYASVFAVSNGREYETIKRYRNGKEVRLRGKKDGLFETSFSKAFRKKR